MSSDLKDPAIQENHYHHFPLFGALIVFRYHMLQRRAWLDLASSLFIALSLIIIGFALKSYWGSDTEYTRNSVDALKAWMLYSLLLSSVLLPAVSAVLGAGAVPAAHEFEMTQSALLSRLKPLDLVLGRLFAALWPVISAVFALLTWWLCAQLYSHFIPATGKSYFLILIMHMLVIAAAALSGTLGFACSTRIRPGRAFVRGAVISAAYTLITMFSPLLFHAESLGIKNPILIIKVLLLLNPASAITECFGSEFDLLRHPGIYDHTSFHDYNFTTPSPIISLLLFILMAEACAIIASLRLRRAYR